MGLVFYQGIVKVILEVAKKLSQPSISRNEQNDALMDSTLNKEQMQLNQTGKWENS